MTKSIAVMPAKAGIHEFTFFVIALAIFIGISAPIHAEQSLENALETPITAPEIETKGEWLNTAPLTSKDLKGKVVLVDFWTYSCINCLRTLPYIKAWYEQYKDKGFVVIGVHAPEFDFEKDKANVEKALKRFNVTYPVVQDNDHTLWNRFNNMYWPAHYLINKAGQVVYTHFGEGHYDVTEKNIRALLDEKGYMAKAPESTGNTAFLQTPETYLGTERAERLENNPENLATNNWALTGDWSHEPEYILANAKDASLKMHFRGGKVFLVLGTKTGKPIHANIFYNGKPAIDVGGKDVIDGKVEIAEHRLYELISLKDNGEGIFEIRADEAGLQAFAFTFGGVN